MVFTSFAFCFLEFPLDSFQSRGRASKQKSNIPQYITLKYGLLNRFSATPPKNSVSMKFVFFFIISPLSPILTNPLQHTHDLCKYINLSKRSPTFPAFTHFRGINHNIPDTLQVQAINTVFI